MVIRTVSSMPIGGLATDIKKAYCHKIQPNKIYNKVDLNFFDFRYKTLMDQTQMEWQCCGVYGYEDWFNTTWAGKTTQCGMETHYTVPLSCCKTQQTSESTVTIAKPCFCGNETDVEAINHNGCLTTVFGSDGETILYLVIAVFGMAALQLIGITLTICIYQRLREINYRRY